MKFPSDNPSPNEELLPDDQGIERQDHSKMVDEKKAVSHSAFIVSLGSLISLVAGLGSQMVIAMFFGAGAEMDAYLTALVIPIYIQAVLLSGLSFVFIPAFIEARTSGKEDEAWSLAGTIFWLIGGIFILLAIAGSFFSSTIISITAPGLDPYKADLAARMLRIIIFTIPLSGFAVLTSGIENARNRFFWPATAGAAASFCMIATLWLVFDDIGAMALAWGYLIGVAVQASITSMPFLLHGWNGLVPLGDARLKELTRLITPLVLFGIMTKATPIIERYYASGLADGELSYLGYSAKTSNIFRALLAASIATALFPAMSRAYSQHGDEKLKTTLQHGLRLSLAIGLPVLAIITAVADPLVTVLYQRGAFQEETTLHVARVLPIVLAGTVLAPMIGNLFTRTFYIKKDTKTVPIITSVSIIIYVLLARTLVVNFGYVGLATSQLVYAFTGIILLAILLIYKFKTIRVTRILKYTFIYGSVSLVIFVAATLLTRFLSFLPSFFQLGITLILSGILYLLAFSRIDPEITNDILELIGVHQIRRLIRKLTSKGRAMISPVK